VPPGQIHPDFVRQKISSIEGLYAAVGANLGVAIMPEHISHPDLSNVRHLATDCEAVEFHAVWLRAETSRLLREYLEILRGCGSRSAVPA